MKVKELIEKLEQLDPEEEIFIFNEISGRPDEIHDVFASVMAPLHYIG